MLDDGWSKGRNDTSSSRATGQRQAKLPGRSARPCSRNQSTGTGDGTVGRARSHQSDSDSYRTHPDWAFTIPGREPLEIRQQYTLDFSRPEVVDGIWQQLDEILRSCPLKYQVGYEPLAGTRLQRQTAKQQGEVYHRHVMGVYELQRRLTEKYPGLLLENCAGGGARFDCGMLITARRSGAATTPMPVPSGRPVRHQPVLPRLRDGAHLPPCPTTAPATSPRWKHGWRQHLLAPSALSWI